MGKLRDLGRATMHTLLGLGVLIGVVAVAQWASPALTPAAGAVAVVWGAVTGFLGWAWPSASQVLIIAAGVVLGGLVLGTLARR
jgi:hypothetical protein